MTTTAPLLADTDTTVIDHNTPAPYVTPLPKLQLSILCLIRLMDPITFTQIFPYINQFLASLNLVSDPSRIGFYSGLVESTFAFFQLISIYEWAKLSEKVGRKPIVVGGTLGLAVATVLFGFTMSLPTILLSRALAGLCSGNAAVLHSVLGELTDSTNQHTAFPLYGLFWPLGSILGPIIGGLFANPAKRFPRAFDLSFFRRFPYFLPSFVTGMCALATGMAAAAFLNETHPDKAESQRPLPTQRSMNFANIPDERRVTVRDLLSVPIIRALSISGAFLCFVATAFDAVFVLFCYTRIAEGGLEFSTSEIGYALSIAGTSSILLQISFLPPLLRRFNAARLYSTCMWMWPTCYILLPCLHFFVDSRTVTWCAICLLLTLSRIGCLAYSISMVLVKENAPSPAALSQSNGLVMFAMCATRALAPAFVSSAYAFSHQQKFLGGYLWVLVMTVVSLVGCSISREIECPDRQIRLDTDQF
ncbi:MFS general substrate transporter [Coprinopsis marcescibilis]|uniref:MFS general substrate transporter n=1 Tax=Coprinopsis marcescibilis TaxID=230819 RepID=A0A5C3LB00_COPMA|nr:MFS general substrate transporter [Coprinopsis marcescibilis]